ncbi:Nitrogen permease regulator 2 [Taphrina deformans PYCC 5710]|uniref:Nitrogen permease regulator 2 n=1 Tax=Taphrina deformans (strain PYCC 5710 / ATCC 11124 / CBS 356.35 / IMI 108563 / JCM 9778 / NBRC 8474) TaxID=1097556 RepID=R4XJ82_TAPDE|nr:Nitrogen permease regulator 2 [Taphrina deformans PYCC 5710]|eukprot:CCG83425.1 Nitrogen permease regulator 2 [Taphrina deformans PYCC 5710]
MVCDFASLKAEGDIPFPRILGVFFAIFHPQAGPTVIYQVPSDFIGSSAIKIGGEQECCVDMDSISEYIIPKQQLCDRMICVCNSGYRVLGYPIRVEGVHYERNAFIFNCCFVFDESEDVSAYIPVVKRLAKVLQSMEELKKSLSLESERPIVQDVIEQVLEDLNTFGECRIPIIDEEVTLNIKLFRQYPQPMNVKAWHVPVPLIPLTNLTDNNWDLTVQRLIPHINGVSSVKQISEAADVDPLLAEKCMEHLLYYNTIVVTDIFQFNAVYAVTPELDTLNFNPREQEECCAYIVANPTGVVLKWSMVFELYASLRHGLMLKEWMKLHLSEVRGIDPRRFITYGIIHGFVYRIHTYPYLAPEQRTTATAALADGTRHFDELCTYLSKAPGDVLAKLQACGPVQLIYS